jgi:hypothetical protein
LFMLPPAHPITVSTFNYAPVAVVVVLVFSTVSWFAGGNQHFMLGKPIAPELSEIPDPTA